MHRNLQSFRSMPSLQLFLTDPEHLKFLKGDMRKSVSRHPLSADWMSLIDPRRGTAYLLHVEGEELIVTILNRPTNTKVKLSSVADLNLCFEPVLSSKAPFIVYKQQRYRQTEANALFTVTAR